MKTFYIALTILVLLGAALFAYQKWLPTSAPVPVVTQPTMDEWDWVYSEPSGQGTQFEYPRTLPTKYVTAQDWPPGVQMAAEDLVCTGAMRTIGGNDYCVGVSAEGAAGSTYTSYDYATKQGDFLVRITFTLRTPQCMNYSEPEQGACKAEQAAFDVDALVDRIASSIRMM